MGDLALNHIIPTALKYQSILIANVQGIKAIFDDKQYKKLAQAQIDMISEISERVSVIQKGVYEMIEARKAANKIADVEKHAFAYCEKVLPFFDAIRYNADKLELLVDDEMWCLPKYREMLFIN
jgi:glutamine synthetase